MAELDFTGEKRLHGGRATANVYQIRIEVVFFKVAILLGQPESADPGRKSAVSRAHRCGATLALGRYRGE